MTICEVTSAQISYNPRLVKEADALADAGYEVQVVGCLLEAEKTDFDRRLVADSDWDFHPVRVRRGHSLGDHGRWLYATLRQRLYRKLPWLRRGPWGLARAYSRYVDELAERAATVDADLYIAHNLQALPAAWKAAADRGSKLGFDAEDFHRGQFPPDESGSLEEKLTRAIEEQFIPECDYVTAASPGIAQAYAEELGIESPPSILNVFPKEERDAELPGGTREEERPGQENVVSLYWYSQVIGHDRGLQDAVQALGRLDERVHLSLRGEWEEGFRDELRRIAEREGVSHRVHRLEPVPPEELVARAGLHDIGLALEQAHSPNRDLCISNKILAYLLAGLPVVATETEGQEHVHKKAPGVVRLCEIGAPEALAARILEPTATEATLESAQERAWQMGEERLNWEKEQKKLVDTISAVLR
jgi:glycosyltransferase involved in cell wall biosynthesis